MDPQHFGQLSLGLGLGLLIGLQRERAGSFFGGIRTFPLIALLGVVCGWLAEGWGAFVVLGGFVALASIAALANLRRRASARGATGQTTEIAALLTFAAGVLLTTSYQPAAVVTGGLTAVLLHLKGPMHAFAGRLTERDLRAIMRFAIVTLIVLPLLPDATFGPYDVLNPREIWWMVVLIVGLGLAGYVSYRLFGQRTGTALAGLLGGLVSSTATTVAYARRVREDAAAAGMAALIIIVASSVAAARVLVEVAAVAPSMLRALGPPLGALFVLMCVISALMWRFGRGAAEGEMPEPSNPAELKSALIFAAVYAAVTFATAAAKEYFGSQALYGVALISGFVDVDAITLSTSRLAAEQRVDATTAWRVIMLAWLVNLVFKTAIAWVLGSTRLLLRLLIPVLAALAGGGLIIALWPALGI